MISRHRLISALLIFSSSLFADITFKVDDVEKTSELLPESSMYELVFKKYGKTEDFCDRHGKLVKTTHHAFVETVTRAYAQHRPVVISPDHIWLIICQGLSCHINQNPEKYRKKLVLHQDRKTITVVRNGFVKGRLDNDWEGVFPEFCEKMQSSMTPYANKLLLTKFSTTGIIEQAAFDISMMETMQNYFAYLLVTTCGIPEITLEGDSKDWELILKKVDMLDELGLQWWAAKLRPVLQEFVAASKGKPNLEFWKSFCKEESEGSGSDFISGRINYLFPYLQSSKPGKFYKNPIFDPTKKLSSLKIDLPAYPDGSSSAPFIWQYYTKEYSMKFVAGFMGIKQDHKTMALRPEITWIVQEDTKKDGMADAWKTFPALVDDLMSSVTKISVVDITGDKENERVEIEITPEKRETFCRFFGPKPKKKATKASDSEINDDYNDEENSEDGFDDDDDYSDGEIVKIDEGSSNRDNSPEFNKFFIGRTSEIVDYGDEEPKAKKTAVSVGKFRIELYNDDCFLTNVYIDEGKLRYGDFSWNYVDLKTNSYLNLYAWWHKHGLSLRQPLMSYLGKCSGEVIDKTKLVNGEFEILDQLKQERYPIQKAVLNKYFPNHKQNVWWLFDYDNQLKEDKTFVAQWLYNDYKKHGVFYSSELLAAVTEHLKDNLYLPELTGKMNLKQIDELKQKRYVVQKNYVEQYRKENSLKGDKLFDKKNISLEARTKLAIWITDEFKKYGVFFSGSILESARHEERLDINEWAKLFLESEDPSLVKKSATLIQSKFKEYSYEVNKLKEFLGQKGYQEFLVKALVYMLENKLPARNYINFALEIDTKEFKKTLYQQLKGVKSNDMNKKILEAYCQVLSFESDEAEKAVLELIGRKSVYLSYEEEFLYQNMLSDLPEGVTPLTKDKFIESLEDENGGLYTFNRNFICIANSKEEDDTQCYNLFDSCGNKVFKDNFKEVTLFPDFWRLTKTDIDNMVPLHKLKTGALLATVEDFEGVQYSVFFRDSKYVRVKNDHRIVKVEGDKVLYQENKLYGIKRLSGEVLSKPVYAVFGEFSEGLCMFAIEQGEYDYKCGYWNRDFEETVKPQFNDASTFKSGTAVVRKNRKYGLIDRNAKFVLPYTYDYLDNYDKDLFVACKGKLWGVINSKGKEIIPFESMYKVKVYDGYQLIYLDYNQIFIIDPQGKVVSPDKIEK